MSSSLASFPKQIRNRTFAVFTPRELLEQIRKMSGTFMLLDKKPLEQIRKWLLMLWMGLNQIRKPLEQIRKMNMCSG